MENTRGSILIIQNKDSMKFYIKNTNTNEVLELEATSYGALSKNFRQAPYELASDEEVKIKQLQAAKEDKINQIKAQRNANLLKPTPQTVTYEGNLANKSFNINVKEHLPIFNSIITILQSKVDAGAINPTRTWTDSNGEVLELSLGDYVSLANHLDFRDAQEYAMCSKRIKALDGLSLEEVENFDITQIIE
jgi:hypothetical protein